MTNPFDEQWSSWNPLPNLRGEFTLEQLTDDEDGLHIVLLNDTGRKIRIDFRTTVAYRLTGRAISPPEWATDPIFSGTEGAFYLSESSRWSRESSQLDCESGTLLHFLLSLPSEIIEVLTDEEPNAAWENTLFGDAV